MDYPYREFCKTCLVRACCTEPCYIVHLIEPVVCINCKFNKTCEEKCDNVIFFQLDKKYNLSGLIAKNMEETSTWYRMLGPKIGPKEKELHHGTSM